MDQPDHTVTPVAARSILREERHPNSVTAPPVNRGAMVPTPWRGFWKGMATAALWPVAKMAGRAADKSSDAALAPWQRAAQRRRSVFLLLNFLIKKEPCEYSRTVFV